MSKLHKTVFVIMPFVESPTRNEQQLTYYFENILKKPIENENFKNQYRVSRSDDFFNITEKIIKDLFYADIVVADLSGRTSNPNVMYELGVRLALSNNPVILIREAHKDNKTIFDIAGFHTNPYDPLEYHHLSEFLIKKIHDIENLIESPKSPVLKIIEEDTLPVSQYSIVKSHNLLSSMHWAIEYQRLIFLGSMVKYAKTHGCKIEFSHDPGKIVEELENNIQDFMKLQWNDFRHNFGTIPSIEHYLTYHYLDTYFDNDLARKFTVYLICHYSNFYSIELYYNKWDSRYIYMFCGETSILLKMIEVIQSAIIHYDDKDYIKECEGHIEQLYSGSKLFVNKQSNENGV